MTTTLRPTAPLQRSTDGACSRPYQVCVNSRPVGGIELSTDPVYGPRVGRIGSLRIDEADRRRGRGTVAALAAEEVLRGWRCTRVEAQIPAEAEAALRLAAALGYVERNRGMAKRLSGPADGTGREAYGTGRGADGTGVPAADGLDRSAFALPEGCRARPMTAEEYPRWLTGSMEDYARSWVERGVPEDEARAKSERDHARLLPDGLATPEHWITRLLDGEDVAGTVWAAGREDGRYVYWVHVEEAFRGRGYGRTLMLLAEHAARAAGAGRIALNVFTHNTPALRLYESLGYTPTSYSLHKPL